MSATEYTESELHNVLIEDHRVAEQGIQVVRVDSGFALVGEVESPQRRDAIMRVIGEVLPDVDVRCDIGVTRVHEPQEVEEL